MVVYKTRTYTACVRVEGPLARRTTTVFVLVAGNSGGWPDRENRAKELAKDKVSGGAS